MRRVLTGILCIALFCLPAASAQTYRSEAFGFAFDYPDAWLKDGDTYLGENGDGYTWLADFTGEGLLLTAETLLVPEYAGLSLYAAEPSEIDAYEAELIELNKPYDAVSQGRISGADGRIPFVLYSLWDGGYEYLYASTVAGGLEISLCVSADGGALTDAARAALQAAAASFTPIEPETVY